MALVIKKKVSLEFLGEEYKDSYIIMRSMSIAEYDRLQDEDKDKTVRQVVEEHFLSGEIKQEDATVEIKKETISELSPDIYQALWNAITGTPDPKLEGQSKIPSSTEPQPL